MALTPIRPQLAFERDVTRTQVYTATALPSAPPLVPLEDEVRVRLELWNQVDHYVVVDLPCDLQDEPASIVLSTDSPYTCSAALRDFTVNTATDPTPLWGWRSTDDTEFPEAPTTLPCVRATWYGRTQEHLEGVRNLVPPFWGRPRLTAFLLGALLELQEISEASYDLNFARHIRYAIGTRLSILGSLVGQLAQGWDQEEYRALIQARLRAARSTGALEDLIAVAKVVLLSDARIEVTSPGPAALDVYTPGQPSFTLRPAAYILGLARMAGVAGVVRSQETDAPLWGDADDEQVGTELGNAANF